MSRLSKPARDGRSWHSDNFASFSPFSTVKPIEQQELAEAIAQSMTRSETPPDHQAETAIAWAEPIVHTPIAPAEVVTQEQHDHAPEPDDFSAFAPAPQVSAPLRELHIKVWDEENDLLPDEAQPPSSEPAQVAVHQSTDVDVVSETLDTSADAAIDDLPTDALAAVSVNQTATGADAMWETVDAHDDVAIDDLPTSSLTAVTDKQAAMKHVLADDLPTKPLLSISVEQRGNDAVLAHTMQACAQDEEYVEHLDTLPLQAYTPSSSSSVLQHPLTPPPLPRELDLEIVRGNTVGPSDVAGFSTQKVRTPPAASLASEQQSIPVPQPPMGAKRRALPLVAALLAVLIIAAVGSWVAMAKPFSAASITNPAVRFQDSALGFSLTYPTGWTAQVDHEQSAVYFYDSSHTDEVDIHREPAVTGDVSAYLHLQAKQLDMTGVKSVVSLSSSSGSWQQLQGSVLLSGASYTEVILVTVHHAHLYAMMQLAPQITYIDEQKINFLPMYTSFQFLS